MDYRTLAATIAREEGVPEDLFLRLVNQESGFQPHVTSSAGAYGLTQLMPATARELGVDPTDPTQNLRGGARYLRQQLDAFGTPELALAAYNAGPSRVRRYGGIPPFEETQNYVRSILGGSPVSVGTSGTGGAAMPDNMQQGLLGSRPAQQGGGFWNNFLGGVLADPDRRARIGMALEGMTLNPNQALIEAAQSGIEDRRTAARTNRTLEWLRSQPNGEMYARMLEAGGNAADIIKAVMSQGSQPTYTNEQLTQAGVLRDDLTKALGDFGVVKSGYDNITTFYNTPNAVSDYALAVAFAKILDPGSVAREGEVAAVQNAGAKVPALGQALKNAITGEGALTEEVRYQIAQLASQIYANKATSAQGDIDRYRSAAETAGLPFDLIYLGGEIPAAVQPTPPASAGLTQSAIDAGITEDLWRTMTPAERAVFP